MFVFAVQALQTLAARDKYMDRNLPSLNDHEGGAA